LKILKEKLKNERLIAIVKIAGAKTATLEKPLTLDSSTPFTKHQDQHYSIREHLYLKDDFEVILHATLLDYGADLGEDQLEKNIGSSESEPLQLKLSEIDHKNQRIILEGGIYGDLLHASSNSPIAKLVVAGFKPGTYKKLELYKTLICEAYLLEVRGDRKLSFFTYYSAIESFISLKIQDYKEKLHAELHHALEHLSLDQKLKIAGREVCEVEDLSKIPVWGDMMGEFSKAQALRNKIAHAHSKVEITSDQLDSMFYCLSGLITLMNNKKIDFTSIRKHIFPKA
jgi:hypothetical protein